MSEMLTFDEMRSLMEGEDHTETTYRLALSHNALRRECDAALARLAEAEERLAMATEFVLPGGVVIRRPRYWTDDRWLVERRDGLGSHLAYLQPHTGQWCPPAPWRPPAPSDGTGLLFKTLDAAFAAWKAAKAKEEI